MSLIEIQTQNAQRPFHSLSSEEVIESFGVDVDRGHSIDKVDQLLRQHGHNRLVEVSPPSYWKKLLSQFTEWVIGILFAAALIAGLMGEWVDMIAILMIVLLNGILGFIQEERASRALAALREMSTPHARVRRDGVVSQVEAAELVPGDIIQLEAGDFVAADARLISGFGVAADESSLTGESVPAKKTADLILPIETPLADRKNSLFMGTMLASGNAMAIVTSTGMNTELGHIAGMLKHADQEPTPLQRRLAELGRVFVVICLVLVSCIFVIHYARGDELMETLLVSVSLGVAAVPEGLPAVVTIALALGLQRMVRKNALIRKLPSVETLGSVTIICSDKTGTLTRNEMTARQVYVGGVLLEVTGRGYEPAGEFQRLQGSTSSTDTNWLESPDLKQALAIATKCNHAALTFDRERQSWVVVGDPTEGALRVLAKKGTDDHEVDISNVLAEIPFDSERKAMSVITDNETGGATIYTKGAPEVILEICSHEQIEGEIRPLTLERKQAIRQSAAKMAEQALRVLALAYRVAPLTKADQYLESELVFSALVGMIDPPREEVRHSVQQCHQAGIRPVMITGDHPKTALAIARELAIGTETDQAVTGAELDLLSDEQLEGSLDRIAVFARVTAAHKLRVVKALKKCGHVVAMTGDGVNDAPAIKSADIGIAMGITGTDVTKEAADMVLTDDNFSSIVNAVEEGRGIFDNIQKFVHYLLSCNAGEVMLMLFAALLGYPVPLLAIQILWINLVTDGLPALALAMEPPEPDIMKRRPRPPREPVITTARGLRILFHGLLVATVALIGFVMVFQNDPENLSAARTAAFAITAFSQLVYALVCRSHRFILPQLGWFTNRYLFGAIVLSALLQLGVMTIPVISTVFNVASISLIPWGAVIILSLIPATIIEGFKLVVQKWGRGPDASATEFGSSPSV